MEQIINRVGFVATGDELIHGDILNTNSRYFSERLVENGIEPGRQVVVSDDQLEIEQAIRYLLKDHRAVITIGGLGPTEDDRTRYALADAIGTELIFNDQAWQWVVKIITSKGLDIPDTNRQQALLPINSEAIYNANGTAAACYIKHNDQDIFMLPGPPNECFPIFNEVVLPKLLKENYQKIIYKKNWLLLGVSESKIADQLEKLMPHSNCTLGYRVHYPYLEIKLRSPDEKALTQLSKQFSTILKPAVISESKQTASEQLFHYLEQSLLPIHVQDNATFGLLEATLKAPSTQQIIHFYRHEPPSEKSIITVKINGLDDYWKGNKDQCIKMPIIISIQQDKKTETIKKEIFNRGKPSIHHAVEVICWELLNYLKRVQPQHG